MATPAAATPLLTCTPKRLPRNLWIPAAAVATDINPNNRPPLERLARMMRFTPTPERIAVLTTKVWHTVGVHLTVGFLDNPPADLRKRILRHMNAWAKTANVRFRESASSPQVRIARAGGPDGGYWSYLGTITKDGQPIIGGLNIDATDFAFAAKIYPKKLL